MANIGILRRVHAGSTPEPVAWSVVESLFDACFGADAHELPRWPGTMHFTTAGWTDGHGRTFSAERLGDVEVAYVEESTAVLHFSGHRHEGLRCDFEYWPGAPRPRARLAVEGSDEEVAVAIAAAESAFPLPFEGAVIFLSWGGERSRAVAEAFVDVLAARFPAADVFASSTSTDPGDDRCAECWTKACCDVRRWSQRSPRRRRTGSRPVSWCR